MPRLSWRSGNGDENRRPKLGYPTLQTPTFAVDDHDAFIPDRRTPSPPTSAASDPKQDPRIRDSIKSFIRITDDNYTVSGMNPLGCHKNGTFRDREPGYRSCCDTGHCRRRRDVAGGSEYISGLQGPAPLDTEVTDTECTSSHTPDVRSLPTRDIARRANTHLPPVPWMLPPKSNDNWPLLRCDDDPPLSGEPNTLSWPETTMRSGDAGTSTITTGREGRLNRPYVRTTPTVRPRAVGREYHMTAETASSSPGSPLSACSADSSGNTSALNTPSASSPASSLDDIGIAL